MYLETLSEAKRLRLEQLNNDFLDYPDNLTQLMYQYVIDNAREIHGAYEAGF